MTYANKSKIVKAYYLFQNFGCYFITLLTSSKIFLLLYISKQIV